MRLLVTGANGVVGRHIDVAALPPGVELVRTSRTAVRSSAGSSIAADLSAPEEAAALIRAVRPTHLIHLAWETRPPTYWEDVVNLAWIESTTRLAAEFAAVGGRRFVQVGSCAEYDWRDGRCIEGSTPDRPATRYGKSKLAAFRAVEAAAHDRFEAVEGRIFFVYGPGEAPARFVPSICRSHVEGVVPRLGSGRVERDFLHAADIASALVSLALSADLQGVVNIGSGTAVPLSDVATTLATLAGADQSGLGTLPDRPGDPPLLVAATDRLRQTGWRPSMSLDQGLAQTLEWWRNAIKKEAR